MSHMFCCIQSIRCGQWWGERQGRVRDTPQVGPKTALNLVQKHGSMEKVLQSLDKDKYPIPEPFPYEEARCLFKGTRR